MTAKDGVMHHIKNNIIFYTVDYTYILKNIFLIKTIMVARVNCKYKYVRVFQKKINKLNFFYDSQMFCSS